MQKPMSALLLSLIAWIFAGLPMQVAVAAPARGRLPQKLLLTVGVSHYQDARWKALQFADKDAQDVYTRLKDTYDALPPLTSDRYGAEGVTLALVRQQLKLLEQQNTREDDVIIVYFSGHGSLARSMDRNDPMGLAQYFVTSDTDFSRVRETALPRAELIKWFNGLRSKRKALILDSCFAGEGKGQWTPYVSQIMGSHKGAAVPEAADTLAEGAAVYSASSWGLPAEESEGLRGGVYTHFLLKGMGEDFDGDGAVRLSEAHLYALDAVEQFTQKRQRPTVAMEITGKDPVVVSGAEVRAGRPLLFAWNSAERGLRVLVDNVRQNTLNKGSVELTPGRRRLTLIDPMSQKPVFDNIVQFKKDTSYNVSAFLYPTQPNNVMLDATVLFVPESALRNSALPAWMPGARLGYFTENITDLGDVSLAYTYFFPKEHAVKRDVRLRSVERGGIQNSMGTQTTQIHAFEAGLVRRQPVDALSNRARTLVSESFYRGNLGALYVVRESELFETRKASSWMPGGDAAFGLSSTLPNLHMRFMAESGLGLWGNTLDVGSSVFLSTHVSLGIGGFW